MTLKEQINQDFIAGYKAQDIKVKSALSFLRAKILDAEKANKNVELTDAEVLKVILSSCKQRKQSVEEFTKAGRLDLVEKEESELAIISKYLPQQLTAEELVVKVTELLSVLPDDGNRAKRVGQLQGMMNKKYSGQFDGKVLSSVLNELIPA